MSKYRKVTNLRPGWQVREGDEWLTVLSALTLTFANGVKETRILYVEPVNALYDGDARVLTRTKTEQGKAA